MSQVTAKRRRRQMANGYRHLDKQRRPVYRRATSIDIHQAINLERLRAQAEAARKRKGK